MHLIQQFKKFFLNSLTREDTSIQFIEFNGVFVNRNKCDIFLWWPTTLFYQNAILASQIEFKDISAFQRKNNFILLRMSVAVEFSPVYDNEHDELITETRLYFASPDDRKRFLKLLKEKQILEEKPKSKTKQNCFEFKKNNHSSWSIKWKKLGTHLICLMTKN